MNPVQVKPCYVLLSRLHPDTLQKYLVKSENDASSSNARVVLATARISDPKELSGSGNLGQGDGGPTPVPGIGHRFGHNLPLMELVKFRMGDPLKSKKNYEPTPPSVLSASPVLDSTDGDLGKEPSAGEVPRYECSHCPQIFYKKRSFLAHYNSHTGTNGGARIDTPGQIDPNGSGRRIKSILIVPSTPSNSFANHETPDRSRSIPYFLGPAYRSLLPQAVRPPPVPPSTFPCPKCPELPPFLTEKQLEKHLSKHTRPFVCEICLKRFARKDSLINHLRLCAFVPELIVDGSGDVGTTKPTTVQCPDCPAFWTDVPSYRRHVLTHTHPYECNVCGSRFARATTLADHSCHPVLFQCPICGHDEAHRSPTNFPNLPLLEEHLFDVHRSTPLHKCGDCGRKFCLQATLEEHICHQRLPQKCHDSFLSFKASKNREEERHDCHHTAITQILGSNKVGDGGERKLTPPKATLYFKPSNSRRKVSNLDPFICEVCGQKFSSQNTLKSHTVIHGERLHKCDICGKRFHRRDTLKVHGRVHEPPDPDITNPFGISSSSLQIGMTDSYTNHGLSNDANGPAKAFRKTQTSSSSQCHYQCNICRKVVKSKNALDTHLKLHRSEKGYQCDICLRRFLQKGNLQKHQNIHAQQRYSCPLCHKIFSSKEYCAHHIREHTEEKKYSCPECGKKYLLRHRMLDHYSRAHTSNAYKCPFCETRIKMRHSLKRHFKRKHSKMTHVWDKPGYVDTLETSSTRDQDNRSANSFYDNNSSSPQTSDRGTSPANSNTVLGNQKFVQNVLPFELYPHLYINSDNQPHTSNTGDSRNVFSMRTPVARNQIFLHKDTPSTSTMFPSQFISQPESSYLVGDNNIKYLMEKHKHHDQLMELGQPNMELGMNIDNNNEISRLISALSGGSGADNQTVSQYSMIGDDDISSVHRLSFESTTTDPSQQQSNTGYMPIVFVYDQMVHQSIKTAPFQGEEHGYTSNKEDFSDKATTLANTDMMMIMDHFSSQPLDPGEVLNSKGNALLAHGSGGTVYEDSDK